MGGINRREWLAKAALAGTAVALSATSAKSARAARNNPQWAQSIRAGLDWLAQHQSSRGQWSTPSYPVAMAALAGTALIGSGSTTTQGPYAKHIARCTDYLISKCRSNGLIGEPDSDNRYTYGHGFSMLMLSQVLGEEGYEDRRKELIDVLNRSVDFCCKAQTTEGGWGYMSAKDGANYDEVRPPLRRCRACAGAVTRGYLYRPM